MSNNKDKDSTSKESATTAMPFRLPSRAELEERRKQLDANKPAIHFKPKGIAAAVIDNKGLDTDATNSATPRSSSYSSSSTSTLLTHTTTTSTNGNQPRSSLSAAITTTPVIVSSRQHYQQQQQKSPNKTSKAAVEDDDFGFEDDLGDVNFNDDLFDDIDRPQIHTTLTPRTLSSPASTQSSTSTLVSAPTQASAQSSTSTLTSATAGAKILATPPVFQPKSKAAVVVKSSQRGNPLLQFIRNVPYEYGEVVPDFVVGTTSCVLFLR